MKYFTKPIILNSNNPNKYINNFAKNLICFYKNSSKSISEQTLFNSDQKHKIQCSQASFEPFNLNYSINNSTPVNKSYKIDFFNNKRFNSSNSNSSSSEPYKKPSLEQLLLLKEKLTQHLPKFLHETHPYNLYTPDIVFENFYKEPGKITVGALQYAVQLTMLRLKVHWKFSHARLEVLKITHDESDSTIKVRWRIVGIRGIKSMIQPWKIKAWKVKEAVKNEAEWNDGFSILYVRGDGLIYKHTLQRVMPQNDEEPVLAKDKKLKIENLDVGPTICTK